MENIDIVSAKNMIFFAESGLTSTSANHVANLAKEYVQQIEMELSQFSFYESKVSIIGSQECHIIKKGIALADLLEIDEKLKKISWAKSFIAWLREAIKAKENIESELRNAEDGEICRILGIEMPLCPRKESAITEDELIAQLNVKERNHLYSLEARAAVLGKFIHPDGAYSCARKELSNKINNANEIKENGRDSLLYSYTPSVCPDEVEDVFFKLQAEYRSVQAELNGHRHAMQLKIKEDEQRKASEYQKKYNAYGEAIQIVRAKVEEYRLQKLLECNELRITIPNDLKEIYNIINSLGK